jgi:hypothetical protein
MQVAMLLKNLLIPFYQDLFVVESYELIEDGEEKNMRITYRVNGKRKASISKKLTEIVNDKKLLNCFSRNDCFELGLWYGRLREKNKSDFIGKQ